MAIELADDAATRACGAMLGGLLSPGRSWVVTLEGELGAGKTTLVRGLLGGLGHTGRVRSPTYTLIEPYRLDDRDVLHLDLYRLADPGELEYLGLEDLLTPGSIALVEWPEWGRGLLPPTDIALELSYPPTGAGRRLSVRTADGSDAALLRALQSAGAGQ